MYKLVTGIMNKPKGGRGKVAAYSTKIVRLPEVAALYGMEVANIARDLIDEGKEEKELYFTSTEREQAISLAKDLIKSKKSAKHCLQRLLEELYGTDINLS